MSRIAVIVMSSDKTSHVVPGFFHQWEKQAGHLAASYFIVCQSIFPESLPEQWGAFRAGQDTSYQNWAGHLRSLLFRCISFRDHVLLLMDDYWLCQELCLEGLTAASRMMSDDISINKIDLSGDRNGFPHDDFDEHYVISHNTADYLTSTQAALWRPKFLYDCLQNDAWTPWQFELDGTNKIRGNDLKILGQKTPSIQYANVSLRGHDGLRLDRLKQADIDELRMIGAIP